MIPKSLHTVSVLVAVAIELRRLDSTLCNTTAAVDAAALVLGYGDPDDTDTYGLKAAAVRKLEKAQRPAPAAKRSTAPQPGSCMGLVMDALRS